MAALPSDSPVSTDPKTCYSDPFAVAFQSLNKARPPRSARLQEAAAELSSNRSASAERIVAAYLARFPLDADAIFLRAEIQIRKGELRSARATLRRCLELTPDFLLARYTLAKLHIQLNEPEEALQELQTMLSGDSHNPLVGNLQAKVLQSIGQVERSLRIRKALLVDYPQSAEAWHAYGNSLRASGAPAEEIAAAYREALRLRPTLIKAYWSIANLKTLRFTSDELARMEGLLNSGNLRAEHRAWLHFSSGKALDDAGSFERAFQHYARGNALARMRTDYDADRTTALVSAAEAVFTPEFFNDRKGWGCPARGPIFIVGMQRSGSTLVEQILASHSAVEGTAELPCLPDLLRDLTAKAGAAYPGWLRHLSAEGAAKAGEDYLKRAAAYRRADRPFFTDKASGNLWHLGMIRLVLPAARIIDVRRHPAANGFSRFRQYFGKTNLRLVELGREYRDYVKWMAHFDRVMPGKVHRVIYEELVANPEQEIRKLLTYLGLPFEDACLEFHATHRAVRTPSSEQVRKPVFSDALEQWRHYERWLSPLLEALGPVLSAYPAVPEEYA